MPRTTITSLLNRFRNTSAKRRGRANRRRQRPADLEVLESRVLLTVAPLANNDQFTTAEDATLSPAAGLLENDSDPQGYDIEVAAINGQSLSVSAGSEIATATADPNLPIFTTSLNAQNYYGFRFELTEATTIERVGGNFQFFSGTGPFAAIVALDSQADFPDAEDLSTPDVVATAVIPLAYQDDGEKSAEINADLQPGWYAVMFGTEQFGSTGITGLYLNSAPVDGTTFIHSQPEVPRFLTPTPASKIPNSRLFVTLEGGAFVPTDFALPSGAALNVSPDGQFVYDPQDAFNDLAVGQQGSEQFTYTIRSSAGLESTATSTITVHGVNDIPTAAAQSGLVSENSLMSKAAAIGLLSGAADPDGDSLFVSAINGAPLVPGQPISLPSGAEITVNADGSLLYNPTVVFDGLTDGETGSDSLTFTISDGNGGTAQETLSITINGFNDFPEIDALTDPIAIDEGETAALSGTVSDSEIGVLNVSASVGEVSLAADGETFTWEYAATDDAPTEFVVITVTDQDGRFSELFFDLTVNNVEPTLILDASVSADQLAPLTLVLNNVEDPGDDTILSATVDWGDGNSTTVNSLDEVQHVYSAAPGIYQLHVTLQDEDGTYFDVASTQVVITNFAPVIESVNISETVIDEGQSVTLDVRWIDGDETHTVDIDWGDGNLLTVNVPSGNSNTSIDYTYADDTPFGTFQDDFDIIVTVSDSEASVSTISAETVVRSFEGLRQIGSTGSTSVVDVAIDRFGNQYVAGSFSGELSQNGEVVATTGAANTDWYVTRYDSSGQRDWTRTIGRQSFAETLETMAVTPDGRIVLAGSVTNSTDLDPGGAVALPNGGDNVIVTLSSDGDFEDAVALPGSMYFTDAAVDPSGNLAFTGGFFGSIDFDPGSQVTTLESPGNFSGFVMLFDTNRELQWARGLIGTDFGETTSVALSDNAVTVGGFFRDFVTIDSTDSATQIASNGNYDVYVAQFDSAGAHQWHAATGGSGDDRLYDLAVSRDGSVFAAASARGMIDVDPSSIIFDVNLGSSARPLLWALTPDGSLAWHDDVRTSGNSSFRTVSVSPNDQRVVAGGTFDSLIFNDDGTNIFQPSLGGFVSVYGPLGQQEYLTNLTGPGFEQIDTLAVSSDGKAVFGGTFNQSVADAEETQTLSVTSQNDGFLATYTLTAAAPLHPALTVRNTAPVITSTSLVGDPADDSRVIYSAEFFDPGTEPDSTAAVNWGDGTTTTVSLSPEQTSLQLSHLYVAGPETPANGTYDVTFTLTDKDFAIASTSQSIAVASRPEVTFDTYSLEFNEDAGTVQIPVLLSVPASADITIPIINGGSAIDGTDPAFDDYSLLTTQVFIPSGQTTGTLTLQILDDNIDEFEQETIELTLLETAGVTLGRTPIMTVSIFDNDVPTLSFSTQDPTFVWEDHGSVNLVAELSGPRDFETIVQVFVSGSAANNEDYTVSSPDLETDFDGNRVLRIPAGLTAATLQVDITDNQVNETFYESLRFSISPESPDVQVGDDSISLYVRDNDPLVTFGDASVTTDYRQVTEGASVPIDIELSAPTNRDIVVPIISFGYSSQRASSNDYAVPNSVTIPAGSISAQLSVPALDDNLDENAERFMVGTELGGSRRGKRVYVNIQDNDTSVVNVRARRNATEGTTFPVTVSLTKPSVNDVRVRIRFSGSASPKYPTIRVPSFPFRSREIVIGLPDFLIPDSVKRADGSEAEVTIPAGSVSATFQMLATPDNRSEGDESIIMKIVSVTGGAQRGTGDSVRIPKNGASSVAKKDVSKTPTTYADGQLQIDTSRPNVTIDRADVERFAALFTGNGEINDTSFNNSLPLSTGLSGLLSNSTLFFDANFNARRDFLDLDGDGVFSDGDLVEPAFETALDGSAYYDIPDAFDLNGNGTFDNSEGQLVMTGGIDTSVDQPLLQAISAPLGYGIISPMSTVVSELMQQRDLDLVAASQLTLSALGLEGFALAANNYLFNAAEGDAFAGEAYRTDVRLVVTTRLITALFEDSSAADALTVGQAVFQNIAEKLNGAPFDFESTAFLQSVMQGVSFRLATDIDSTVTSAAAAIISSLQHRVSEVPNDASRQYVDAMAQLHKTAEVELVPVIRGLFAATDLTQVVTDNTGTGLDALVSATQVSNVLPPEMYVSDIAVQEGVDGTTVAILQVALRGGTDVPVSVSYGTTEGSADEFDSDYVPTAGVLTWQPGDAEIKTIQVEVNGDGQFEEDEYFDVTFSDADGLVMRHDFGRIFILNDDVFGFTAESTDQPTNVRVVADGDQIEVYQDDVLAFTGGISDSGPITISAFDSVETAFELEILSPGPLLTNGIQFVGGGSELDTLVVSSTLTEGSLISLTDATSGQVEFDTGLVTFSGIEAVLDSLSATIEVQSALTEGGAVTLSAFNPVFPVEVGDSLTWTITGPNGLMIEGSGQDFTFDAGDNGDYQAKLVLQRVGRGEVRATAEFSTSNIAPTAVNDVREISENVGPVIVDLLNNDSDPAGAADQLTIVAIDATAAVGIVLLESGTATYDPNGQFEGLAVGQTAVDSFSYTIDDGDGGSDTATVSITILGANDAPTVGGPLTVIATEDDATFTVDLLAGASDIDFGDVLAVDAITLVSHDDSGIIIGTNTLTVDPLAYNHLAAGDSEAIEYAFNVVDGNGGTVAQTAIITITGTNDRPAVSGPVNTGSTEDDATFTVDLLSEASDVDLSDVLNVDALTLTSGDDTGVTVGTNELTVDPAAYDHLAVGESEVIGYSYNVVDGNGGIVPQTAMVTISGVNDGPTVSAQVSAAATEDDGTFTVDLLAGGSDVDISDVLNVDSLTLAAGDDSGVTVGGNVLTIDPAAYNHLAVGESEVIGFSYNIVDGNGGIVVQTATVTISGSNDAPTIIAPVSAAATEDDGPFTVDLLEGASDEDLSDVLNVDALTLTSGDDNGVTVGANALIIDPAAYNYLAVGESEVVTFSYDIVDGNGGSVAQTATVTILGVNDVATFADITSSHPDAGNASSDGLITLAGTVRDADTSDELTVTVNWGDGSAVETLTVARPADGFSINHQYSNGGLYEITATIDDGNGSAQTVTATAAVEGVGLIGDALFFIGTDYRDKITIDETWVYDGSGWWWNPGNWDRRIVAFGQLDGDWFYETFDPSNVSSLHLDMLGGNDRVIVTTDVGVPVNADLGSGHDLAIIASSAASILAGDGNDEVWTGSGNDTVNGGAGDDLIGTDGGSDTISDPSGDNTIFSGSGNDSVTTGDGDDFILSLNGHNTIDAGHGNNVIITGSGRDTVSAGDGDDNISTDGGRDAIRAGNGNNTIDSGGGSDIVITGNGNDDVRLGAGDDVALLGSGNDTARGGSGNDAIIGGDGDDDLRGQSGRDVLIGGRGADDLRAGTGDDLLISGRTSYDDDLAAIDAIMQAWTSDNSYAARVSALQSGATSGGIALTPGSSVFSDEDNEVLRGQGGQNWYFAGQSSDSVPNNDEDEFVDWLDDMNL